MRFYRKCALVLLALALTIPAGLAQSLERAAMPRVREQFAGTLGFRQDEDGSWAANPPSAQAALSYLATVRRGNREFSMLLPSLEGRATGALSPCLYVYYHNANRQMQPVSASFTIGSAYWEFPVAALETVQEDGVAFERAQILLDGESLALIADALSAREFTLELCGGFAFRQTFSWAEAPANDRQRLVNAAFSCLEEFAAMLQSAGMEEYALWDLNEQGGGSLFARIGEDAALAEYIPEGRGALVVDDRGDRVRNLQRLLQERGFTIAPPDGTFGTGTQSAVQNAQKALGLPETGCASAPFVEALLSGTTAEYASAPARTGAEFAADGLSLALSRFWFAEAVAPANSADALSVRAPENADNLFFVADGWIKNTGGNTIFLPAQIRASLHVGDARFSDFRVLVEADGATRFAFSLLPLAEARVVLFCEIPAAALRADGFTLRIESGAQSVEIPCAA